jgi:hypothetical protein
MEALPDKKRTKCEIWTRVMGYHRPVEFWNIGKQQEFKDRCYFVEEPKPKKSDFCFS